MASIANTDNRPSAVSRKKKDSSLEEHFQKFKENIIGQDSYFDSVNGRQKVYYADWIASGRLYAPIENTIQNTVGPMVANTHSFSSETGRATTYAYRQAREIIRRHVNADANDILITAGSGMTGVLSRLQRIIGLRKHDGIKEKVNLPVAERPVVLITHMEHHSNHVSWMETIADVVIVPPDENGDVSPVILEEILEKYEKRPLKIGAFTACSNVTGIITPYHEMAKLMHRYGGICLIDFAASAPYLQMDMHPKDSQEHLDAIYFSPHKFLGGPGSCGVLVFNKSLYKTNCPDVPGGGNVKWTDPWGEFGYHKDIEIKEDGGTPGFLQVIRTALAIKLKNQMRVDQMARRETELLTLCQEELKQVPGLRILGNQKRKRIGCLSFVVDKCHYNLVVRLLNDYYGVQVRGGWSCASTYSHYLFGLDKKTSKIVIQEIESNDLTKKPGWVRLSLHPTTTDEEIKYYCNAIKETIQNKDKWAEPYTYNPQNNEFEHKTGDEGMVKNIENWFKLP